jgi:lipopolysaccharide export system permease protein
LIIERYLLRETASTFFGVSLLLVLIYLSGTLIRILAEAAEGKYPVGIVLQLFAYKGVGNLVFILPLAFFLAVLLALGRLYKDSEMAALTACGVGPGRVYTGVGGLGLLVAIALAFLALWFAPWSEERAQRLLDEAQASSELEGLEAGRFNETGEGQPLVYVEAISPDREVLHNIFAYGKDAGGRENVIAAEQARQADRDGDRYLVLRDGHRYEGRPGEEGYRSISFREHGMLMREREVVASQRPRHAVPSWDLYERGGRGEVAELQWRIAVPISAFLFGLLAVPLAKTSPRQGRYGKLFVGILIYIGYNNLLTVARASLGKGQIDPALGLWWVHGLLLAAILVAVWHGNRMRGPKVHWLDR